MEPETTAEIVEIAKALPAAALNEIAHTACQTFRDLIAPLTATTAGIGQLIQAHFDGMVLVKKAIAADVVDRAKTKLFRSNAKLNGELNPAVLIPLLEGASICTDEALRNLWANLLAQELSVGGVHPEVPRILERLAPSDASELETIAEKQDEFRRRQFVNQLLSTGAETVGAAAILHGSYLLTSRKKSPSLSREILRNLGLIDTSAGYPELTVLGRHFMESVRDPEIPSNQS